MKHQYTIMILALTIGILRAEEDKKTVLKTVWETAAKAERAPGAPRYSDVCFSSRWRRPRNAGDPHDTFRDARSFHATRLVWVYSYDPEWIAECRKRGYWFGGTLNTILTDAPGVGTRNKGRILDKDGQRIAAPWMKSWKGYWVCVNSPEYRRTFIAHARLLVDSGVDAIQMDDPPINLAAVKWGGCYCPYCRKRAKEENRNLNDLADMCVMQRESVEEFYASVRREIDQYAKRRIPWSSNNYDGRGGFPYDLFDFGMAELPHRSAKPGLLYSRFAAAARSGRQQIYTFVSTDVTLTRRVIATAYACGGHIIVPYDVYNGSKHRIFGKPDEYSDLYGFVRANAVFLDGFEDAAAFGKGIKELRYGSALLVHINASDVFALVRAQPGKADGPVAIHLVDWRKQPQAFTLVLRNDRFFRNRQFNVQLCVPPPFNRDMHAKVCAQKTFSSLTVRQEVQTVVNGNCTEISVPILNP